MKKHKIAYAVWLIFNFITYATLTLVLRNIYDLGHKTVVAGVTGNLYLYFFTFSIYIYCFAYLWDFLQEHIALADGLQERKIQTNLMMLLADGLSNTVLSQAFLASFTLPICYWMARVFILVIGWLKYGEWIQYSSCDAIQPFCNFDSTFVGINIIVNWLGNNEFGFLLTLICFSLCFIFKQHPKSQYK